MMLHHASPLAGARHHASPLAGGPTSGACRTSLAPSSLDLRGPLNPLPNLAELESLDLCGNRLNGTLDAFLLGVSNLRLLYLSRNDLADAVPPPPSCGCRASSALTSPTIACAGPSRPAAALTGLTRLVKRRLQNNLLTGFLSDVAARLADFNAAD